MFDMQMLKVFLGHRFNYFSCIVNAFSHSVFLNFNPNRDFLTLRMIPQIMSMFFFLQRYTVLRHVHLFYCTGPICCVCVSSDGLAPSSQHRNLHSNCVMQQFYGLINFKGLYFLSLSVQTNSMVMHMLDS